MLGNRKAQSINEYAIIIVIVAMVIMGMQAYMKRGIQGVIKTTADELGEQFKGGKEKGLVKYEEIMYQGTKGIKIHTEREIITAESPPHETDPVREITINKDETTTKGKWKISYNLGEAGTFGASEKTKTKESPKTKKTSLEATN